MLQNFSLIPLVSCKSHSEKPNQVSLLMRTARALDNYFVDGLMCLALVFVVAVSPSVSFAEEKKPRLPFFSISEKTNINTATPEQIATTLNGVGSKKAEAIVAWRKKNGKFTSIDQLTEVKGIGAAIVDKNRDKISI